MTPGDQGRFSLMITTGFCGGVAQKPVVITVVALGVTSVPVGERQE
jgi:hypothetical protein